MVTTGEKSRRTAMPTTQQREEQKSMQLDEREMLNALIGEQVMHTLGRPSGLFKVQVRRLWEDNYRVNVLIGADAASAKVANSYFVQADGDGHISASTPKITKQY
jgi:hypothetical protein